MHAQAIPALQMDTIRSNEVQNILELWFNSDEVS